MGFGILFFGYFLFLNLTSPAYTDLLAGLILLLALYKLTPVNKFFRMGAVGAGIFSAFGIFELFCEFADVFGLDMSEAVSYIYAPRSLLVAVISILILTGIEDVAREVGADATLGRVRLSKPITYTVLPLHAILEFPSVGSLIPSAYALAIISLVAELAVFVVIILNILTIYSAYMHICMPEDVDNDADADKPSRFGIVNKFRQRQAEKQQEYAEYKLGRMKAKSEKQKKKGKRK
ncbi:MAG: hypothetical protein IJD51_02550 [Clostridia bacterium]|nr:hypothetical protein [Clostridia bacterium]